MIHENGKLISGGIDGKLVIHSAKGGSYTLEQTIDLGVDSHPKSIDYFDGRILVGLRNGSIYELSESTPQDKKVLLQSHHEGESWGLTFSSGDGLVYTVGEDNKILVIDQNNRKVIKTAAIANERDPRK